MRDSRTERLLLAGIAIIVLLMAWADWRSQAAAQMRSREPLIAWLVLNPPRPNAQNPKALFLLMYRWDECVLHVIQNIPISCGKRQDEEACPEIHEWVVPRYHVIGSWDPPEPPSAQTLKAWIARRPRTLRFWLGLPGILRKLRRLGDTAFSGYDVSILALEAYRLNAENVRIHALPAQRDRGEFFARLKGAARPETRVKPVMVEILNASGDPGVALQATKVLRWRGLDVVDFGNAPAPAQSTRLIDRTAWYDAAAAVARALGCVHPEIEDAMDSGRREQVTVILGQDYKNCASLGGPIKL